MKNIMGLMGQVKEMQAKMADMQNELHSMEVTGTSGGGLVSVTLNGKGEVRAIGIDPSLLKPDEAEILEDLIMAAHNEAKSKIESLMADKTAELTEGLPLPPGMKLPF
ncbi:MAG: YbaB/EbfC family nucleoid-associated protein [Pseudomonadota bacterium]